MNIILEHYIKGCDDPIKKCGKQPFLLSRKDHPKGAPMPAFSVGHYSVLGRGQFHITPRKHGGLCRVQWGKTTQSSVPGNSAKSMRLDSTYLRIRRVCSVTYVRKKFSHSTDKTQGLFQETSSQSTHISYCVMWTIKSQVIAQLKGNPVLGFCPPWLSKLPCPKLSCFSVSVASFLPC